MAAPEHPAVKYALAGLSCMLAATVTNPIDVIKTRLQLQGELAKEAASIYGQDKQYRGMTRGILRIVSDEGLRGLYKGLSPSLLREASYSSIRIGAYEPVKASLAPFMGDGSLTHKALSGAISGAVGASIACPTDLIKVRMQASQSGDRYRSVAHAARTIVEAEGVGGLWRGVVPTVQRAAILTAAQVGSYDHVKQHLLANKWFSDGLPAHAAASMVAGAVAAVATSPVDVIKTRMMNQSGSSGGVVYRSVLHCAVAIARTEGLYGFYKGLMPNYFRIAPHTLATFIFLEQLRKLCGLRSF